MIPERTSGIILRTRPFTETSLVVHWLTLGAGRIATVAKGGRRPKSPFRGRLDLFYEAELSFLRSRRSDLHTLCEVVLRETHPALRTAVELLQQAAYAAALLEQTTEAETPLPWAFELLQAFLTVIGPGGFRPELTLAFELKLLEQLGLQPNLSEGRLTDGSRRVAKELTCSGWELIGRMRLTEAQHRELARFLHGFLVYHLDRIPGGRAACVLA